MFAQTTMSEMETPEKIQKTKEHGELPSTQNDSIIIVSFKCVCVLNNVCKLFAN